MVNTSSRQRFGFRIANRIATVSALALLLWACGGSSVNPVNPDESFVGIPILDSSWVIDAYPFDSAACAEVLPAAYSNSDSIPAGTLASVSVNSPACWHAHVRVLDSTLRLVRTFDRYFNIVGRKNGDKNRGVYGYVTWDGKNDSGNAVPLTRYTWLMVFDFGKGNLEKVRADIRLD